MRYAKKIRVLILVWLIIYILWVALFYMYWAADFSRFQSKLLLVGAQILFLLVMWRLFRKLVTAAVKEKEDAAAGDRLK